MKNIDLIIIAQSEIVNYAEYSKLPQDRIDLYKEIVYPRMVRHGGAFLSHIDLLNRLGEGISFQEASPDGRRSLLSVWNLPSLSGMHLANYLLAEGFNTYIINNFDAEWDRLCQAYTSCNKPPLVGISTTFHLGYSELRRICRRLHELDPDMEIVVGGAFVNALMQTDSVSSFQKIMRRYGIDYVLHGFHSEADLRDLLIARKQGGDISAVGNLAHFERSDGPEGKFSATASRWNPPVLDEQPALWDQLETPFVNHTVQMRTSCGCPFSCAFCSYPKVAGGFQKMSLETVRRSLESLLRLHGVKRIVIVDDTFNVPPKRFKGMCRLFAEYDFEWYSFLRVQFIDEETARLMRDSGCKAVYLGIESANDRILQNMNKRATSADFERGVALLRKYGIVSMAAFVLGFPGETERTIRDNRNFIETSGVEYYTLKEFYYMAHTPVHEKRKEYGLSGMGNKWSHATMDSRTAYEHKISLFREVKNSCFIDSDTSLWHLVLLQDAGFSFEMITMMQENINAVIEDQLAGIYDDNHPALHRLERILAESKRRA